MNDEYVAGLTDFVATFVVTFSSARARLSAVAILLV